MSDQDNNSNNSTDEQIASNSADTHEKYDEWEIDNLPNRLTLFRVMLIPIIVGSLYIVKMKYQIFDLIMKDLGYIAGWSFVVASITDFFDGYIARKRGIVTVFGSFLDPIADKFLVVSSLIMLQALGRIHPLVVVALVL
ncbi:MAG: CDP-alcohol phosphatidyltransferase family protein, partial [Bdellovibrionota bacterium]|nr:CDP-alcohol phosphatidyltransferase family protein [Bdellovibrionota bacterium]